MAGAGPLSALVGVEITGGSVRAVALGWSGAPRASVEIPWDAERPEVAVIRLQSELGAARRIALAIGLDLLQPKRVRLPPAPADARRAMIALEPERFFAAADEPLLVALTDDDGALAFGASAERVERWIEAFSSWAPVESVEPAPSAAARALAGAADGFYAVPAGAGERGLVEIRGGRLHGARRVPDGVDAPEGRPVPAPAGAPAAYAIAVAAARGVDGPTGGMLLSERRAGQLRARRAGRVALAAVTCTAAVVLALWSLDRARERTLVRLEDEIARATPAAAEAIALRDRLGALDVESAQLAALGSGRPDPLPVLAALSERLPRGATVLSAHAVGSEWQIEGTAADAAALVPLLDHDPRFQDVRVLSASSRFREGERSYETFSIAFRAAAASD